MKQPRDQRRARLPADTPVARKIAEAYPAMPAALRKFADLVLSEPLHVARLSVHDAVALIDVSVATANRFATTLGYEGYPEFRSELIAGFEALLEPFTRMERKLAAKPTPATVFQASLKEDIANLEETLGMIPEETIMRAARLILGAERIFIAGFDLSAHLGGLLAIGLSNLGTPVRTVESGGGTIGALRHLVDYGPKDLVIGIAFPHYFRETLQLVEYAHDRGTPVLGITDGLGSPLAALAAESLFVSAHHDFNPPSSTAIAGVVEGLVAAVNSLKPAIAEKNRQFVEESYAYMAAKGGHWGKHD
ncbi:MurR/RpiR family transcriptional regulator [Martelella alba]|uniref:MurR/RpiR family transcriptional regulator n=1 Tax=Martelella alba TaxID=2590451 RepID=A0A506U7V1_9HYPH|nr:MurR/RpiR family transcriptional regulator [Martelella alba]TPW29164.1 MurR/RpiR family transcriptional regulator [Martelella alba]